MIKFLRFILGLLTIVVIGIGAIIYYLNQHEKEMRISSYELSIYERNIKESEEACRRIVGE
jgi:hypothetical protein